MPDEEHPFGEGFNDLEGMISAMAMMAQMNRATYMAHIEAGFTPFEAMELTKYTFEIVMQQAGMMFQRS